MGILKAGSRNSFGTSRRFEGIVRLFNAARRRFFIELVVWFLVVALAPVLVASVAAYGFSRNVLTDQATHQLHAFTALLSRRLDDTVLEYRRIAETIATDPSFVRALAHDGTDVDSAELYRALYLLLAGKPAQAGIFVLDRHSRITLQTRPVPAEYDPLRHADWGVLRKAAASPHTVVLYAQGMTEHLGALRVLTLGRAVYADGELVGYVVIDLYQEHLLEITRPLSSARHRDIVVWDANRLPVYDTFDRYDPVVRNALFARTTASPTGTFRIEAADRSIVAAYAHSAGTGLTVVALEPLRLVLAGSDIVVLLFSGLGLVAAAVAVLMAFGVARSFSLPLREVVRCVERVTEGDLTARAEVTRHDEFGLLARRVNSMVGTIEELIARVQQRERSLRLSELKALQAQIHPHFIFNCLEMIRWYIKLDRADNASELVVQLGKLLRAAMNNTTEVISLDEEIKLVRSYLAIQKMRFEEKLSTRIEVVTAAREIRIPKLIVQPIVENAVLHGIEPRLTGGTVRVRATIEGSDLVVEVADDGVGMDQGRLHEVLLERVTPQDDSTGIRNVAQRLRLYYGEGYGLTMESTPDRGTRVRMRMRMEVS